MYSIKTLSLWLIVLYIRVYRWFERGLLHVLKWPLNRLVVYMAKRYGVLINGDDREAPRSKGQIEWIHLKVRNDNTFIRVINEATIGLMESYMEGWWDCEQISELILRLGLEFVDTKPHPLLRLMDWVTLTSDEQPWERQMEVWTNKLGTDFFEAILGEHKLYSCGNWKTASTLEQAQLDQMELLGRKLVIRPGMSVLDLGCGYGAFTRFLANNFNAKITGCTISAQEAAEARKSTSNAEIVESDYRDLTCKFDRIACIQMLEHLGGPRHYRPFFKKMSSSLTDEGLLVLQCNVASTVPVVRADPFSRKYFLRNAVAPHHMEIMAAIQGLFRIEDVQNFGAHWERSILAVKANLEKAWKDGGLSKKYDVKYYRMFRLYLQAFLATVQTGHVQMWQIVLSKTNGAGIYESVR